MRKPHQRCHGATALLVTVLVLVASGCNDRRESTSASTDAAARATPKLPDPGLAETSIVELQARMARGELDSLTLVRAYLDRIAAIDDAGPMLNAVIELNPDALRDAEGLDAERRDGKLRGPLHGIPVLLKDNIDALPMANSAGSLALAGHRPADDAFLVARLRDAGAVILGKTNLSEWANFRSSRSISGWSARGGQTRNPHVLDRSPCGSSSGTGAAIAASLASAGVGTETNGSILCPASVNGVVGIKPTVGLVSRDGIIPIAHSQDTAGPMARSVADAAALLQAMAAVDDADDASTANPVRAPVDYLAGLDPDALRGARIGVLREHGVAPQPDVEAAFDHALEALKALGAELVDARIETDGQWRKAGFEVLLYEFRHGLDAYLAASGAPVRSLDELIAYNRAHTDREMPLFGQELFEQAQAKGPLTDKAYRDARDEARRLAKTEGIDATLARQRLDALVVPTAGPAWPIDPVNGDHFTGAGYGVAAVAGTPSITVPMGEAHGLPLGIAFLGPAWSEAKLVGYAYAFEQATRARRSPRFLPTVPLPAHAVSE
ncbi:MAG TPA: amidase [Luteimonas sp.]|nr:amidase [Luteimonas sp.]HRO26673.1 amidase [Luteimonas sp.]HRP72667.1 amidase [Luteimonas sp.]